MGKKGDDSALLEAGVLGRLSALGFLGTYTRLPAKAKEFITRDPRLTYAVATWSTYKVLGGTLTAHIPLDGRFWGCLLVILNNFHRQKCAVNWYKKIGVDRMRILVVEDDAKIASFIVKGLEQAGYAVDQAADGEEGLYLALNEPYDAAIIDLMLPKLDGLSLIQEVRRRQLTLPIIIVSAKRTVDDRIKGLETGSDDYLVKPFSFAELLARLQALLRRASGGTATTRLEFADLVLDLTTRQVWRREQKIELQPKEFALLAYLLRQPGRVISKTMILEHVWDLDFDPQTNVVDVLVCRLRNKIDRDFEPKLLHTIRGVGYVLKLP